MFGTVARSLIKTSGHTSPYAWRQIHHSTARYGLLKNLDPLLTADVLHALRSAGHGDVICICDVNFPAVTTASGGKKYCLVALSELWLLHQLYLWQIQPWTKWSHSRTLTQHRLWKLFVPFYPVGIFVIGGIIGTTFGSYHLWTWLAEHFNIERSLYDVYPCLISGLFWWNCCAIHVTIRRSWVSRTCCSKSCRGCPHTRFLPFFLFSYPSDLVSSLPFHWFHTSCDLVVSYPGIQGILSTNLVTVLVFHLTWFIACCQGKDVISKLSPGVSVND